MRILFMTVGTGVGKDENRVKNLAHGLLSAIKEHNPNKVIFFGSDESKETVKELERMYYESEQKKLNYKFVTIKNVDNFYDCFSNIEEKIIENKDDEILIDYTSGTKTMTTSAAIAAMLYQKSLFITTGKRGENGVVIPGTEEIKKQNLFAAYDKYLMDKTKEAFNLYRYEDAKNHINKIVAHSDKEILKRVIEAYSLWDKFNHDEAWKILKDVKLDALNQNKQFLAMMDKKKKEGHLIEDFLIPDLLNNAFRRIKEGKYDDATARLYRAIEMIAQYRLKDRYGIDPSNVDTWKLKVDFGLDEKIVEEYENMRDGNGIIKLTLSLDFKLLKDLKDEIGDLKEDKELLDLLSKRNSSILAHGLEPIDEKTAKRFYEKVLEIARRSIKDFNKKIEWSEFPKL